MKKKRKIEVGTAKWRNIFGQTVNVMLTQGCWFQ